MREAGKERVVLPKNFRQVGEPKPNKKIYIEDYVVTYLTELAQPGNIYARGAILLGKIKDTEEGQAIFIKGAMEAQNLELDLDETIFSNEVWAEIKQRMKRYFPELEIVGWFLSRIGFSVGLNDKIVRTHMENFEGENKVLYMMDELEGEDAFYLCERRQLRRVDGYYIYYEKNREMQEYMVKQNEGVKKKTTESKEIPIIKRDESVLKNYRNILKNKKTQKKNKKKLKNLYTVVGSCAIMIVILGVLLFSRDSYQGGEEVDKVANVFQEENEVSQETWSEEQGAEEDDSVENTTTEIQDTSDIMEDTDTTEIGDTSTEKEWRDTGQTTEDTEDKTDSSTENDGTTEGSSEEAKETMGQSGGYYIVQPGDTLASISSEIYESLEYVEDIAYLNQLTDQNKIYTGQKLLLPSKE